MNITLTVVVAAIVILITALVVITIFGTPMPSDNVQWAEKWECVEHEMIALRINDRKGYSAPKPCRPAFQEEGKMYIFIKAYDGDECYYNEVEPIYDCTKQIKVRVRVSE